MCLERAFSGYLAYFFEVGPAPVPLPRRALEDE